MPSAASKNVALTSFRWDTSRLNSALLSGFRTSVYNAARVAESLNPAKSHIKIVARVDTRRTGGPVGIIKGLGPLAHLFEGGVGEHVIAPGGLKLDRTSRRYSRSTGTLTLTTSTRTKRGGKKAMFGPGLAHPISGPILHPGMDKRPYIQPAGQAWPTIYRRDSSTALRGAGYRRR